LIISETLKYVFVSNPKTGTHSFYKLLKDEFEGVQQEGRYHENQIPEEFVDYFTFSTCRHPFARAVSAFHVLTRDDGYKDLFLPRVGGEDFLSFCRWLTKLDNQKELVGRGFAVLTLQSAWLKPVRIDQFVRIENANEDFAALPFVQNTVEVPTLLARKHESWAELRCDESEALLREWLAPDFEFLPYDPETVPDK
jgi:hypothetical protein